MEQFFNRKYKLETSENFDEYMKAVGVNMVTRKLGAALSPIVSIYKEDDLFVLTSNSTFKNVIVKFKPGVEMDDVTPDGRKIRTIFTMQGSVLTEKQTTTDGQVSHIVRTFSHDAIIMVLTVANITCTRVYKFIG